MFKFLKKHYVAVIAIILLVGLGFHLIIERSSYNKIQTIETVEVIEINDKFNYTGLEEFLDNFEHELLDEEYVTYSATATLTISTDFFKGYYNTSTLDEEINIGVDNYIDAEQGTMDIALNVNATEFTEVVESKVFFDFDEEGNLIGTVLIDGEEYDLSTLMLAMSGNESIEDCFALSITAICVIVGAVVGGTVGGICAWKLAKAKNVSKEGRIWLVVGGVFIGAVVGGLIGYGAGTVGSKIFASLAKSGSAKVARSQSFKSFNALKTKLGSAGKNKAWHHIVEQNSTNIKKFGAAKIHNTANVVKIPSGYSGSLHSKLTGYYNSIDRQLTGGKTVRNWLSTKSYDYQYEFGVKKLLEFAEKLGVQIFIP